MLLIKVKIIQGIILDFQKQQQRNNKCIYISLLVR